LISKALNFKGPNYCGAQASLFSTMLACQFYLEIWTGCVLRVQVERG
jgi:hypothetical protein